MSLSMRLIDVLVNQWRRMKLPRTGEWNRYRIERRGQRLREKEQRNLDCDGEERSRVLAGLSSQVPSRFRYGMSTGKRNLEVFLLSLSGLCQLTPRYGSAFFPYRSVVVEFRNGDLWPHPLPEQELIQGRIMMPRSADPERSWLGTDPWLVHSVFPPWLGTSFFFFSWTCDGERSSFRKLSF